MPLVLLLLFSYGWLGSLVNGVELERVRVVGLSGGERGLGGGGYNMIGCGAK